MIDKLIVELLNTKLSDTQEKIIEDNLFNLLVKERLDVQIKLIESTVEDELDELTFEEKINLFKIKLGY